MESTNSTLSTMSDEALINYLRRAASIWFKNTDLLLLEEFIRRYNRRHEPAQPEAGD